MLLGVVAGQLVLAGQTLAIFGLAAVALPVFMWRKPEYGPTVLLVGALAVEQFGYTVGPRAGAATAGIPLFHGIGSLHVNPSDILLASLFGIYVAKSGTGAVRGWPSTPLARAFAWLLAVVVLGVLVGKMHGGQIRYAFTETRPYFYLATTFLLASVLITTRKALRTALWAIVVTVGFKAGQGLLIFLAIRHLSARPDAVLAHEEALFFSMLLLFTLALWLFDVKGSLRTTATALVPLVIAADLANTRRAAWLVLGVGVIVLLVVSFVTLPRRRHVVGRILVALMTGLALYLPAYWNKSGGLAQPARAIHSAIKPSTRDQSSDLYRLQEDQNLLLNIRQAGPLGKGFGVPIDYALPIQDISSIDPLIKYIPHNGVLYILMRMGILGGIAFWSMLGLALVAACRLARSADREVAVIGALVSAMLVAYAFEGHTDQGFFYYRVAFVMGTLLGLMEAAARLRTTTAESARPVVAAAAAVAAPGAVPLPPRVVVAPPAPPVAAPVRRRPSVRRLPRARAPETQAQRLARLVAAVLFPLGIAFLVWVVLAGGSHAAEVPRSAPRPVVTQTFPARDLTEDRLAQGASRIARATAPEDVVVAGIGSGSWLQVRRGSADGPVLYEGVLADGQTLRFSASGLWLRAGAAARLSVTVDGRALALDGTVETTIGGGS